jgi:iron complex outermembrane recepter protein
LHYVGNTITSDLANTNILYTGAAATINGVLVRPGDPIQLQPNSFSQPSYTTLEGAFGVSKDDWSLQIFGDNLTNARPQLFTSANDGEKRVTTSRPRTIGLRFSYKM